MRFAINESFLEPDAYSRATAAGWRQYQQQLNPSQPKTGVVDWRLLKEFTGYTRDDLIGFCLDEGLPPISGKLTPHEARTFRDVVLCNWAVVEGYFSEHWQGQTCGGCCRGQWKSESYSRGGPGFARLMVEGKQRGST